MAGIGNPVCVNQTNLNGKLRKKLGGPNGGPSKKLGGHGPPRPPLRIATARKADDSISERDHLYVTVLTGFRGPQLSSKSSKRSTELKRLGTTGLVC